MTWYTISLSQHHKAKALGVILVDVTVKSGDQRFAPHADVLWAYKREEVSDEEYTRRYREKLENLFQRDPGAFEELLSKVVSGTPHAIACYCRAGKFCHRHILREFLEEIADDNEIVFRYLGEIL